MIFKYFLNKYCSIFTVPVLKQIDYTNQMAYFVGEIESIDDKWLILKQNGKKSIINMNHVVSIAEEEIVIKKEEIKESKYLNVNDIESMIKNVKK